MITLIGHLFCQVLDRMRTVTGTDFLGTIFCLHDHLMGCVSLANRHASNWDHASPSQVKEEWMLYYLQFAETLGDHRPYLYLLVLRPVKLQYPGTFSTRFTCGWV